MTNRQLIFTSAYVEKLLTDIKSGSSVSEYFGEAQIAPEGSTLESTNIETIGDIPLLTPRPDSEVENAIRLYEYYPSLNPTQASDKRFWTYLSHITFRDYVQQRWGPSGTFEQSPDNEQSIKQTAQSVLNHWFIVGNSDRQLRRHALARLWWAARLTVAPWEESEEFSHLKNEDRYVYTRILLGNEDIYSAIMERSPFKNARMRFTVLEFLRQNPDFLQRENYRSLMKKLVLTSGLKKLGILNFSDVYSIIEGCA